MRILLVGKRHAVCGHAAVASGGARRRTPAAWAALRRRAWQGSRLPRFRVEGVARHRTCRRGMHHVASLQTNTSR